MPVSVESLQRAAARYPLLTPVMEIELGRQIQTWQRWDGGPDKAPPQVQRRGRRALDKFLTCNLRLAHYIARRFRNRGLAMEDLIQAATEGLLTACLRFEPKLGYRFSSYGVWYALQACQVAVAHQSGAIKLPTTVSEAIRRGERVREQLRIKLGRMPTDSEIETAAKFKPGQLRDLRMADRMCSGTSLDRQLQESKDGGTTYLQQVTSDDCPATKVALDEFRLLLNDLIAYHPDLTPQQRYLLTCRYLNTDQTPSLARMASLLNMNRETLRRLERKALDRLRDALPDTTADYRTLLAAA